MTFTFLFFLGYFGKNKVQYKDFHWKVAESQHFRVFYYQGGDHLKDFAIGVLEEAFREYVKVMPRTPKGKIPVLIYNSPDDFRQTNVIFSLIDEGVGGFTEVFKRRVVVPFAGSYDEFRHVLRHELVHVFQYEMFSSTQGLLSQSMGRIPLWSIEGMAEYVSIGWDITGEVYVRDLVLNDLLVPVTQLGNYGGYLIYKEGQAIYYYIEEVYGRQKVREFISNLAFTMNIEQTFRKTLNISMENFSKDFSLWLKEKYYPYLADFDLKGYAVQITDRQKNQGYFNIAPDVSPDGDRIVFITDRNDYSDIYVASITGRYQKKLISGNTRPDLENLHLLEAKLDFSPDGKTFTFVARGPGYDILYIADARNGKIRKKIPVKSLDGIRYPAFSPDGKSIALVGMKDGRSDIYVYHLDSGDMIQITDDYFTDLFPVFDGEGNILFISDRNENFYRFGDYAIFRYDGAGVERISPYMGKIHYMDVRKGHPVLALEYRGTINLFEYRDGKLHRITNVATGIYSFSFDREGNLMATSMQMDGAREILVFNELKVYETIDPSHFSRESRFYTYKPVDYVNKPYRVAFSIDWIAGVGGYSTLYGGAGYFTMGLSDWTGDNWIIFSSDLYTQDITNMQFFLDYLYLKKRWDLNINAHQYWSWAIGLQNNSIYVALDKNLGGYALTYYPFNRFDRLEMGFGYDYKTRYVDANGDWYADSVAYLHNPFAYVGFSHDRALYYPWGPVDGDRLFVGLQSSPIGGLQYHMFLADARKYFRISRWYIFAFRLAGGRVWGRNAYDNPFLFYDVRGWRSMTYFFGNNFFVLNSEFRFPFIKNITFGMPPIRLSNIRGALFFDMGYAWFDYEGFRFFNPDGSLSSPKAAFGFSTRWFIGFADVILDIAWRTDLKQMLDPWSQPIYSLYFGLEY